MSGSTTIPWRACCGRIFGGRRELAMNGSARWGGFVLSRRRFLLPSRLVFALRRGSRCVGGQSPTRRDLRGGAREDRKTRVRLVAVAVVVAAVHARDDVAVPGAGAAGPDEHDVCQRSE